ncbi:MAG TPA: DUF72 domain-containing protein [Acidimicrobiaceae bacterium]|nr:DUF72 domain-containing protein [Acidimicrobiaceae bacterium]
MWANRSWVGRFLPRGTVPGTELAPYSHLLNAVEGNTTFYATPPALAIRKWAQLAASDFRMVFKAPRALTHDRRLRGVGAELAAFSELLAPLGARLGGITLQLPASFAPSDLGALADTARQLPAGVRWSVEVRHPQFCGGPGMAALHRLLEQHGMERVVLDTTALFAHPPSTDAGREEWRTKPRLPLIDFALTENPIVRFIGCDHPGRTDTGLAGWDDRLAGWLEDGRSPTFFVHTPDNTGTPGLARALHERVRALVPSVEPLPHPPPILPAEQGSLF